MKALLELLDNKKFALVLNGIIMTIGVCNVPDQDGMVFGMILLIIGSNVALGASD